MGQFVRTCIYGALGCAHVFTGDAEAPDGGATGKAGSSPATLRPPRPGGAAGLGSEAGGTISQVQQLLRTYDWFVRPLPALSPYVSLSSFHIHAHEI